MDQATALRLAQECFEDTSIEDVRMRSIARLWAGMGNIYQVHCASSNKSLIVKYVHPRLSSRLSIGDQRKLDSYLVEASFYQDHAQRLIDEYQVPLPKPYKVERHLDNPKNPTIIICMSPLQDPGYSVGHDKVMEWLAKFHAATWQADPDKLQPVGSYWHLDTRPDEWDQIPRKGWEGRLKLAARAIDERLKRDPLQCWVHGDTKDANILKYDDDNTLSFCDFQYVGRGPPTKDLAYYLCSSGVDNAREQTQLLGLYFEALTHHLTQRGDVHPLPTRQELDDSLELANADYCRFMAGWGYWGSDLAKQVKATLNKLDGGKTLKTEEDYREAVERVFG